MEIIQTGIGYCRVSTKKQEQEGESLENQEEAIRNYCKFNNIQLIGVFKETYTGKKSNRPVLNEAINNAKINKANYLIIFDIDRFSREGFIEHFGIKDKLEKFGIKLKDCKNILQDSTLAVVNDFVDMSQYAWNKINPSEYAEVMLATIAKDEGKKILQRMITREIQLEQEGYFIRPANFGFKNIKIETPKGKRPILTPHEIEGPFMIEIFDLVAEGKLLGEEIIDKLNKKGFKTRKRKNSGGGPLTIRYLRTLISNPIYAGINISKWTGDKPIRTLFSGLVSIEKWNKANKGKYEIVENGKEITIKHYHKGIVSENKKIIKKRKVITDKYIFSGVIIFQGRKMRPGESKNNVYYRQAKNQKIKIHLSQKKIEEKFIEELASFNLPSFLIKPFRKGLIEYFDEKNATIKEDKKYIKKQIEKLENENEQLLREKINGQMNGDLIVKIINKNDIKINNFKIDLNKKEQGLRLLTDNVAELLEMFTDSQKYYIEGDFFRKNILIRLMVAELEILEGKEKEKLLKVKNTEQFDIIRNINYYIQSGNWCSQ